MQFIGSGVEYELADAILEVINHKVAIPYDLLHLIGVYYNTTATKDTLADSYKIPLQKSGALDNLGIHNQLFKESTQPFVDNQHEYYKIAGNYIHTSFQEGVIGITYNRLLLAPDGLPMIPDHPSFSTALLWYITRQMILGGWKHPAGINYEQADMYWQKYCSQARSRATMPSIAQSDLFLKNWVHLAGTSDRFANNFNNETYYTERKSYGANELGVNLLD